MLINSTTKNVGKIPTKLLSYLERKSPGVVPLNCAGSRAWQIATLIFYCCRLEYNPKLLH